MTTFKTLINKMTQLQKLNYYVAYRRFLTKEKRSAEDCEDFATAHECKEELERIEKEFFSQLPTVAVKFCIGYRWYYQNVIKIGKSYFDHNGSTKMTASCGGYRNITEIEEVTDKMHQMMIQDSIEL